MSEVVFRGIGKSFGAVNALHTIDLTIPTGQFVVFVGPSGCGKTTLMRIVAGLEDQTRGDVLIDGEVVNDLTPTERGIAMVFQSYALYPHLSVKDNLNFPLKMAGIKGPDASKRVTEVAEVLQIGQLLDRRPSELSGGQKQRVAIGRTIVRDRRLFLFDEPLSNLDADLRVEMRLEIQRLHRRLRSTMIYVTHDQVEAMTLADTIVIMRQGNIEQIGTPDDLYNRPCNTFVASFLGSPKINFIKRKVTKVSPEGVEVTGSGGQRQLIQVPVRAKAGDEVVLGIRPEDLSATRGDVAFSFQSDVMENLGATHYAHGTHEGERMTVEIRKGDPALAEGLSEVRAQSADIKIFGADGVDITISSGTRSQTKGGA